MEEKEYEALLDMFTSPGWKLFQEGYKELEETLVRVAPDGAVTNDQWQYARGQIHQLRATLGYENYVKVSHEQAESDKLFDLPEVDDVDFI